MRILLFNHEYPPYGGGSGVAMKHLAEALVVRGHRVLVLTAGPSEERCAAAGVDVVRFPVSLTAGHLAGFGTWISFLRQGPDRLRRYVAAFRPHVVNSHFVFPAGYVVACSGVDPPHVTSVVGADIHDPTRSLSADRNPLVRRLTGIAVASCAAITTPSEDLTRRTLRLFPGRAVHTVSWGVPAPPALSPRTPLTSGVVIVCLCRLVRRKRIDLLLEAVARLTDPSVRLVIMGYGPEADELKSLASRLGIASTVTFTGEVSEEEKAAWLDRADVFCLPSEHEGFGLVFLEAMHSGAAVIASDVGGQRDILRDGVDGYLVPVGDVDVLHRRLAGLVRERDVLRRMQDSARQRARLFSPDRCAEAFLGVYAEAGGHRGVDLDLLSASATPSRDDRELSQSIVGGRHD